MDEQCVADIAASVVGGDLIARSKDALDEVYQDGSPENRRIEDALVSYGRNRFEAEFKFIVDEVRAISSASSGGKLRTLLFSKQTTNPFPAMFAVLFIAFHELLIGENKVVADYEALRNSLSNLDKRVDTSRGSTSPTDRRQNVNTIKGLISPYLVPGTHADIYGDQAVSDIDAMIRRSDIEAPHYEFKQGILRLDGTKTVDAGVQTRILKTIPAIANNGKDRTGTILIGVADKDADAERVRELYGLSPRRIGRKFVVGVRREADALGETTETYLSRLKNLIRDSDLSEPLKGQVLSNISYTDYFGLGVIVIRVPPQGDVSLLNEKVYIREVDETIEVKGTAAALEVAKRFR